MSTGGRLYAFDQCSAHHLPGGRVLVRNPRNGRHAVITPDVYGALLGCRRFATLEEHAERLLSLNPGLAGDPSEVVTVLDAMSKEGLLVSPDAYAVTLQPTHPPRFHLDKPVVAIITWERPEALERCLASAGDNVDPANVARYVIIDDSRTDDARARNRASTEAFAETAGTGVLYLGAEEQKGFLDAIVRQVPALEAQVRFLIDRERWAKDWTSGLARTLALLLSVGQRLVVLDDDILCEVYEPDREPGVGFAPDRRRTRFYPHNDAWRETRAEQGTDPVLRHLGLLGSELADALGALGVQGLEPQAFRGAELDDLERLRPDTRVLITECGSLGDPGTASLNWLVNLEGDSLAELLADDATLDAALRVRNSWVGQEQAQITPRGNMSQMTGLDNRGLLPPYGPVLRGEDRLFGDMVKFLHPDSVVVDQAWGVPHLPIPQRTWSEQERRFVTSQPFEGFGMGWIDRHQDRSTASEPLKRLAQLAAVCGDFAERSPRDLRLEYERTAMEGRARDYRDLHQALEQAADAPAAWRGFLQEALDRLNHELVDNPADAPVRGYPKELEGDALIDWWRTYWRDFGQALRAWPAIRQAARQVQI